MLGIAISERDRQISRTVDRLGTWPARLAWLALPLLIGTVLADALAGASTAVQWLASVGLWGAWALVLVAALVPRTVSLTALRVAVPAAAAAALAAVAVGDSAAGWRVLALVGVVVALATAFFPSTGQAFVDGESYGDEQRFPLRVPGPLLVGPLVLAWAGVWAVSPRGRCCWPAGCGCRAPSRSRWDCRWPGGAPSRCTCCRPGGSCWCRPGSCCTTRWR